MRLRIAALSIPLLLIPASFSLAQNRRGGPSFSTAEQVTVQGAVDQVRHIVRRNMSGTHVILKSDAQTVTVLIGPAAYLTRQQLALAKGDRIGIAGWRVKTGDGSVVVARQLTKDGKTYTLRDEQGIPRWSRGRWQTGGD